MGTDSRNIENSPVEDVNSLVDENLSVPQDIERTTRAANTFGQGVGFRRVPHDPHALTIFWAR